MFSSKKLFMQAKPLPPAIELPWHESPQLAYYFHTFFDDFALRVAFSWDGPDMAINRPAVPSSYVALLSCSSSSIPDDYVFYGDMLTDWKLSKSNGEIVANGRWNVPFGPPPYFYINPSTSFVFTSFVLNETYTFSYRQAGQIATANTQSPIFQNYTNLPGCLTPWSDWTSASRTFRGADF
jgi:hypothetical protein